MDKKVEWRCIVCNRLFGHIRDNGELEIISRNKQIIVVDFKERKAVCKCGNHLVIGENILKITFHAVLSTGGLDKIYDK